MKKLTPLLLSAFITVQSIALSPVEYRNLSTKCLKPSFEELPSQEEYFENLTQRISSLDDLETQETLVKNDFASFDQTDDSKIAIALKRLKINFNQKLFFKLSKEPTYTLDKYINSWLRHSLTANEKQSYTYILSLRTLDLENASSSTEKTIGELMQTFKAPSIAEYKKRGFSTSEAKYIRHVALLQEMLFRMEEHFDPQIYFHIESSLKAEAKFVWQAFVEQKLIDFSTGRIDTFSEYENSFQPLFKSYFERRASLLEKNLFQSFS